MSEDTERPRDSGRVRLEAVHGWEAASAPAKKVLVAGAAGGFGAFLCRALPSRFEVIGLDQVDRSSSSPEDEKTGGGGAGAAGDGPPRSYKFYVSAFDKRTAEDVFKRERPDALVHVAFRDDPRVGSHERYRTNVIGTMRLLEHAARYHVARVVVLSTGAVYGAHPLNPTFVDEESPLRAIERYPEIRDRVEADQYVQSWLYRRPETTTVLLRPAHIVGPHVGSPLSEYLNGSPVPVLLGFDPMMDLVHEDDVVRAIELALGSNQSGVYNIPGPGAVPLSEILRALERTPLTIPHVLAYPAARLLRRVVGYRFETPQADFLRYPLVLSGERAKDELDYVAKVSLGDTIKAAKRRA